MKDELAKTIKSIKEGEKEEFEKNIDKLNPIITKYVRAIYDGDADWYDIIKGIIVGFTILCDFKKIT